MAEPGFRPLVADDLPLLAGWLGQPHVRAWWGAPETEVAELAAELARPTGSALMVALQGHRPVGYMQDWPVEEAAYLADQPRGSRCVDVLVGDPADLGRGLGRAIVAARSAALMATAPRVLTDPDPDNRAALATYAGAGFRPAGHRSDDAGRPVHLMIRGAA